MLGILKDLLVCLIILGANTLHAITGFAGTMLAMPPTIKLLGVNEAKALLNAISQISSLMIVLTSIRHVNWKIFARIFVLMTLGIAAGVKIFEVFPVNSLLKFYGAMIICIGLWKMFSKKQIHVPEKALLLIVLAAGIIEGMFVSGGSLLVIYATAVLKDKEEFRATLALTWVTIGFYITTIQYRLGNFTPHVLVLLVAATIMVCLATMLGTMLLKKIPQETFMKITYVLLLISGTMAIL